MTVTAAEMPPEPASSGGPPTVTRFEANLLRILRFFLGTTPFEQAHPLIVSNIARPKCLSKVALHLVRDSLSKGCVRFLVRSGAWRQERFLRAGSPIDGRLWERTLPDQLGLDFTKQTLDFLMWIAANKPAAGKAFWSPVADTGLTAGDDLLLFLAFAGLRMDGDLIPLLRSPESPFTKNPLCWLAFPDDFASNSPEAVPDFTPWMTGTRALILEAMQHFLMLHWLSIERGKGQIVDWDLMRLNGQVQERVLLSFLVIAERAQRPDLTRFVLGVASQVLAAAEISPIFWTGSLNSSKAPPRLVDRIGTQRSALSLLRALDNMQQWERRARLIGYFDEGFAASQLFLSDWEGVQASTLNQRGQRIIAQFDPLRAPAGVVGPANPPVTN